MGFIVTGDIHTVLSGMSSNQEERELLKEENLLENTLADLSLWK